MYTGEFNSCQNQNIHHVSRYAHMTNKDIALDVHAPKKKYKDGDIEQKNNNSLV